MSYTYPISEKGQREYKLSLIKEIFAQIKFIGERLKPFAIALQKEIIDAYIADSKHNAFGHMFDALYDKGNMALQEIEMGLRVHVNRKAGERRASFTEHLKQAGP